MDAQGLPLTGLPVSFDVVRGTGALFEEPASPQPDGTARRNLVVPTDASGRASVWFAVGKLAGPGVNVVTASNPSLGEGVTFTATTQRGAVAKVTRTSASIRLQTGRTAVGTAFAGRTRHRRQRPARNARDIRSRRWRRLFGGYAGCARARRRAADRLGDGQERRDRRTAESWTAAGTRTDRCSSSANGRRQHG